LYNVQIIVIDKKCRLFDYNILICIIIGRKKKPRGCAAHMIHFTSLTLSRGLLVTSTISSRANSTIMKQFLIIYFLYTFFQAVLLASPCVKTAYRRTNDIVFQCIQLTTLQQYLDEAWTNTTIITIFDSNIPNIPG